MTKNFNNLIGWQSHVIVHVLSLLYLGCDIPGWEAGPSCRQNEAQSSMVTPLNQRRSNLFPFIWNYFGDHHISL